MESLRNALPRAYRFLAARGAEARLAVRVAVAGVITFACAHLLGLQQGYWAVFTAVIVMQASVGGSVKATLDRLTGTLGGAIYGGAIALVVAGGGFTLTALALVAALLPLAFVAAIDPRFRVAPVTAVIVLISPFGQAASPVWFTIDRIGEIALGSIVALAVSLAILPARAHNLLTEAAAKLVRVYADFLGLLLAGVNAPVDAAELRRLQVASRRTLVALEGVADEAQRERTAHLTSDPDPEPVARTSQRIRNDLIMLARSVSEPLQPTQQARLAPLVSAVAAEGTATLHALAAAFDAGTAPPSFDAFDAALRAYHAEIARLRSERGLADLTGDQVARLFTLGFALDQIRKDAGDLADRAGEFARPAAASG